MRTESSPGSKGGASLLPRPRPLDSVSVVFAGFIFLVLLSQLSAHVLAQAILSYQPPSSPDLVEVQRVSVTLAVSAAVLGLAFGSAVLLISRKKLSAEIDVYRANGLPLGSTLRRMLAYHPVRPLVWLLVAAGAAIAGDSLFDLDALIPLDLAVSFAALLLGWIVFLTFRMFGQRGFREGRGRVG